MQEEFLALVAEERERGCTVFISSHELDEVQRICDRVGIVRSGRLIAVEQIHDLLGRATRRVSAELAGVADVEALRALPGVADLAVGDGRVTFAVSGELDAVVKALARSHVVDLTVGPPTLEEVFLTYYDEGEER